MQQNVIKQYGETNSKIEKERNWIFISYVIFTVIVYVLPSMKIRVPYMIAALLMLASFPFLITRSERTFKYSMLLLFFSLFYVIRYAFFSTYGLSDAINEGIRNIRFFLPVLWGTYALNYLDKKRSRVFLLCFFTLVIYVLFNTLLALEGDPEIARLLAQGTASDSGAKLNSYRLSNIGGFEFSYMMGIIALCLMWLFLVQKNFWVKTGALIGYVLTFYYILQSQYTTLLLLTFIGTVILLFMLKKNILFRIVLILLGLILIFSITDIFYFLSNVFEGSVLERKFLQIANALATGNSEELGSRPELLKNGLIVWLRNPIFGSYDENLNTHSLFMGILAQTGLVGVCGWIYLFYISFHQIGTLLKQYKMGMPLFYCVMVFLGLLSFLNPIGYVFEITIVSYFIVPIFIKVFSKENNTTI